MRHVLLGCAVLLLGSCWVHGQEKTDLEAALRKLEFKNVDTKEKRQELADQLWKGVKARREAVNAESTKAWSEIKTRAEWEAFRDQKIAALRAAVAQFPPVPKDMKVHVSRTTAGDGFVIENILYESRPGFFVTANLYAPEKPGASVPNFVVIHSHHNAKTQSELQDMGMTWARLGGRVLIPDMPGHGERRTHQFADASKYPGNFKPGRQDYYFRYNTGMQLHLIGDSLVGWMAWDLMRGIDVLLAKPGSDKNRVILLGSVAGGGDPAGVTAALDPRITAVAPFNFGGPQPETKFPLPPDSERTFNYIGGGSWESTRNLRLSGRDGFLPWVIVGSVAPRGIIHAHEFAWEADNDPVWKRYQKIHSFYDGPAKLAVAHGRGTLQGRPPESTHCNNIGPEHRKPIYPTLKKWFAIAEPDKEYQKRYPSEELVCLTAEAKDKLKPQQLHEVAGKLGEQRGTAFREQLDKLKPAERRAELRKKWAALLGLSPSKQNGILAPPDASTTAGSVSIALHTITHQAKPFPAEEFQVLFLVPAHKKGDKLPVVVGLGQAGRRGFLPARADVIAELLRQGVAVCLPDLRGTNSDSRGKGSASTSLSASEQMFGRTLVGTRLEELNMVLDAIRSGAVLPAGKITLWGDALTSANPSDRDLTAPLDADKTPAIGEPVGGLLALLGGLFHDDVEAVYVRGGLVSYRSVLDSPYIYHPHDAMVPGARTAGDLCDIVGALSPRSVRLEALVDGLNRQVDSDSLTKAYAPALNIYNDLKSRGRLTLSAEPGDAEATAKMLVGQ